MKKLHVAVIDDGIDTDYYNIGSLLYDVEINEELQVMDRKTCSNNNKSHGTVCAAIIKKYSPEVDMSSIKILNHMGKGNCEKLVKALLWCADQGVDVVNLSLGSTIYHDFDTLRKAVNYAYSKGLIIIAACSNYSIYTYPAALGNVIGVKSYSVVDTSEDANIKYRYLNYSLDGIEIASQSIHELQNNSGKIETIGGSNSFAAPFITSMVCNTLTKYSYKDIDDIKRELFLVGRFSQLDNYPLFYRKVDWINKAVVINIQSIRIESVSLADEYFFATVREFNLSNDLLHSMIDVKHDLLSMGAAYDTVIIKVDSGAELKVDSLEIIKSTFPLNKNIVYIDDNEVNNRIFDLQDNIYHKRIWHPSICNELYIGSMIRRNNAPVISIIDGAGDLLRFQKQLYQSFIDEKYNCLSIVDICEGILLGFEFLPSKTEEDAGIAFRSTVFTEMCNVYTPDIVLLGIQLKKQMCYLQSMKSQVIPDINIFLFIEDNIWLLEYIDEFSSDSECIVILYSDLPNYTFKHQEKIKIIQYNRNCMKDIYCYILSLFHDLH